MSGSTFTLLDTNIVLYHVSNRLKQPLQERQYAISVISEIELLSYSKITPLEANDIQNFIEKTTIFPLTNSIKNKTINLRRQHSVKTPDAIVAATASCINALLMTNDKKLLNISELNTESVEIVQP